jgi:hypothetical protein
MTDPIDDEAFLIAFRDATLPPAAFTHEAHLWLAWLHLRRSPPDRAIHEVQEQIQRYARHLGALTKYHCTLTVAAMKLVQVRMTTDEGISFDSFIKGHPELMTRFRELVGRHYTDERLASSEARMHYLEPDLIPFDGDRTIPPVRSQPREHETD